MSLCDERYRHLIKPADRRYVCETGQVFTTLADHVKQILALNPVTTVLQSTERKIAIELQAAKGRIVELTEELADQKANYDAKLAAELKTRDAQLAAVRDQLARKLDDTERARLNQYEQDIETLGRQLAEAQTRAESSSASGSDRAKIDELERRLVAMVAERNQVERLNAEIDVLNARIAELEEIVDDIPDLKDQLQAAQDELTRARAVSDSKQVAELKAEIAKLRARLGELDEADNAIVDLTTRLQTAQDELDQVREENSTAKNQVRELQAALAKVDGMKQKLRAAAQSMDRANQSMEETIDELKAEKENVRVLTEQLEQVSSQLATCRRTNQVLNDRVTTLEREVAKLAENRDQLRVTPAEEALFKETLRRPGEYIEVDGADEPEVAPDDNPCPKYAEGDDKYTYQHRYGEYVPCPSTSPQARYCVPTSLSAEICPMRDGRFKLTDYFNLTIPLRSYNPKRVKTPSKKK